MNTKTPNPSKDIAVRYDKSEITYATQFLASPGTEELMLDFSSGLIKDSGNAQGQSLPIHTRLAMPWTTVERLAQVLNQVVSKRKHLIDQNQNQTAKTHVPVVAIPTASLPKLSSEQ